MVSSRFWGLGFRVLGFWGLEAGASQLVVLGAEGHQDVLFELVSRLSPKPKMEP